MNVALIDYGSGNLRSVARALAAAGASDVRVTADPAKVAQADRIVLPGVGAFGACIAALRAVPGLVAALERRVGEDGTPLLGICVGHQLFARQGEEHGTHRGLGWIGGRCRALAPLDPQAKVPHMGWNRIRVIGEHPLMEPGEAYFLHSYTIAEAPAGSVLATAEHGGETIVAAIARDNVVGVQFHPEKSQRYGIALLERFLAWRP